MPGAGEALRDRCRGMRLRSASTDGAGWAPPPWRQRLDQALAGGDAASPSAGQAERPAPGPGADGSASTRCGWRRAGSACGGSAGERAAWGRTGVRRLNRERMGRRLMIFYDWRWRLIVFLFIFLLMECSELLLFGGIWGTLNMVNLRIDAGLIVVVEWGICHTRF
ncbi:hypothetical protein GQ55_9G646100 [Panicum hallii var. hallii]|uniref:Uncharacterized protein n=1 Tax=Panicum hallii var. hallii TaxID=1504633 RepID=A0A2T7CIT0_9POAL|nr:hypothetical protein GQ55_9G646100 [Panicum hallii var. hallii]